MRISVFGLGYVGTVSATCLAADGHDVIGVDPNTEKVRLVGRGDAPMVEAQLPELLQRVVAEGRLTTSTDYRAAVAASDVALVCVGTPSRANGDLDLSYVREVIQQIGHAVADRKEPYTVVVRSTMLPGSTRALIPLLEQTSGKRVGVGISVAYNPEFLREGTSVDDYYHPAKIVIGAADGRGGEVVASLYEGIEGTRIDTTIETAEMMKYVDNSWHALKVTFGNEIGRLAKSYQIDGRELMELFMLDTKLNISSRYLRPGFSFGGSCLPKELRAISYAAKLNDLDLPVLDAILPSNHQHTRRALELAMQAAHRKVGVLGLSFKAGTDDLRESPLVELVEQLIGKGYDLRIYDPNVNLAALMGANRDYILHQIPHISSLLSDSAAEVIEHAETVVLGTGEPQFKDALELITDAHHVIDLVGVERPPRGSYDALCW